MTRTSTIGAMLATAVLLIAAPGAAAAPGDLDPSFGEFGLVRPDLGRSIFGDLVPEPGGGAILVGNRDPYDRKPAGLAMRIDGTGSIDRAFGTNGLTDLGAAFPGFGAYGVARQSDGGILVGGEVGDTASRSSRPAVARLLPDGQIDRAFAAGGLFTTDRRRLWFGNAGTEVAVDPDGRILIVALVTPGDDPYETEVVVQALHGDGSPDRSFGEDGSVVLSAGWLGGIAPTSDGQIYVALGTQDEGGTYGTIVRLNRDGVADPSFSDDGVLVASLLPTALILDRRGRPIVGGNFVEDWNGAVLRLRRSGALDPRFGEDGTQVLAQSPYTFDVADLVLTSNRRIVVSGGVYPPGSYDGDAAVVRLLADGSLDRSFSRVDATAMGEGVAAVDLGGSTDVFHAVARVGKSRMLAVGGERHYNMRGGDESYAAAARFLGGGRPDADADRVGDRRDRCPRVPARGHRGCPLIPGKLALDGFEHGAFHGHLRSWARRCWDRRRVLLIREQRGEDEVVRRTTVTDGMGIGGLFEFAFAHRPQGRFHAEVSPHLVPRVGLCAADHSATVAESRR